MRHLLFTLFALCALTSLHAQTETKAFADSMAVWAARGDIAKLRPAFRQSKALLPPDVRLFCEVVLARDEGRNERMKECIDSLTVQYSRSLGADARIALVCLKTEALMHEGRFTEMRSYLEGQMAYAKKRKYAETHTQTLQRYLDKAVSLSDSSPRGTLLALAARGRIFELLPAYQKQGANLDEYAKLTVRLALSKAFGRRTSAGTYAERLLTQFADSLLPTERTACFTTRAEALLFCGDWQGLKKFTDAHAAQNAPNAAMRNFYQALATAFAGEAASGTVRSTAAPSVRISRDWPLLLPAALEGKADINFLLDTEQRHTVITESDARAAGIQPLNVSRQIPLAGSVVTVRPALVRKLQLGELTLQNLIVYVIENGQVPDNAFSHVLGTDELARIGSIDLREEKLVFPTPGKAEVIHHPDLCFTESGALQVQVNTRQTAQRFYLATAEPENMLNAHLFPRSSVDTTDFHVSLHDHDFPVPAPSFNDNGWNGDGGLLGASFLRNFSDVHFDFRKMQIATSGLHEHTPQYLADYAASGDLMTLERNEASLRYEADETEQNLMRLLILHGKNDAKAVSDLAARLAPSLYAKGMEDERYVVGMECAKAFAMQGKYGEAAQVCHRLLQSGSFTGEMQSETAAREKIYTAAKAFGAPTLSASTPKTAVRFAKDGVTIDGLVNEKACNLLIDPTEPYTLLSEKVAKKWKVDVLYTSADYTVGMVRSLTIGGFRLENVLCRIVASEDRHVTVGFNALALVPLLTLSDEGVMLSREVQHAATNKGGITLRFDNHLFVQGETRDGFLTLRLTLSGSNSLADRSKAPVAIGALHLPANQFVPGDYTDFDIPYSGTLSIDFLKRHLHRLTFDFHNMLLH